jgi:putative hydrolase of the HAD superfamily
MPPHSRWIHSGTRAVVFDAVGTLIHPKPSAIEIYQSLAARQGVEIGETVIRERFIAAYRAEEAIDRAAGWMTSEDRERRRWHTIVTSTLAALPDPDSAFVELFEHFSRPSAWQVPSDCDSLLHVLNERGLILGMGTNYDSRVESVIAGLPVLAPLRDRLVVSAAIGYRKPAAQFFQELVRTVGCESRQVLYVGDDVENDYKGAIAGGLEAVLFDPAGKSSASRRIERLAELI